MIAMQTDLVTAAQAGDREAFGQLVELYGSVVFGGVVGYLRNVADAEEVCQDAWMHAMTHLNQLRNPRAFLRWVRIIARNRAHNFGREPVVVGGTLRCDGVEHNTPPTLVLRAEWVSQLYAALGRLTPLDRRTLAAHYLRGRSVSDLAVSFSRPLGTIKRRLHVARKRLRAEMEAYVA